MVDIERIKRYAKEIRENIKLIIEYTSNEEDFFKDRRNILSVKHLLLECIEGCAVICNHILAKVGKVAPAGYVECFKGLGEIGVFDEEFTLRLTKMAGFRNLLVHHYWKIDDKKVFAYAKNNISDFDKFLKGIAKFVKIDEDNG